MPPVSVSDEAAARLAARLKRGPLPAPPDFVYRRETPFFPPAGAAWAAPFFFAAVLHLYGLWEEDGAVFRGPIRGYIDGKEFVGDDFLWKALWRAVQEEPRFATPAHQASLTKEKLSRVFRADDGSCPVPLLESHAELARGYGEAMQNKNLSPNKIMSSCRDAARPAAELVAALDEIPGYREDPLRRKAFLLALILAARPEKFLPAPGDIPPVLDRHAIRLALRWGLVRVRDAEAEGALERGMTVPPPVEGKVREAAYDGFSRILTESRRSVAETYGLFADARRYCPETATPDCPACFFFEACEKRIELKQPVVRTLSY